VFFHKIKLGQKDNSKKYKKLSDFPSPKPCSNDLCQDGPVCSKSSSHSHLAKEGENENNSSTLYKCFFLKKNLKGFSKNRKTMLVCKVESYIVMKSQIL
jgi:hypothetical protein